MSDDAPASTRLKSYGAKMEPELIARIDALKGEYPGADGAVASRSSVIRGLCAIALAVHDLGKMPRLRRLASRWHMTVPEAVAHLVELGLDAAKE